jgi:hypothetical protein
MACCTRLGSKSFAEAGVRHDLDLVDAILAEFTCDYTEPG